MASENLIIQTAFVGDLLLSIPLILGLRRLQPTHSISLVCRQPLGDFFIKTKLVDRVFEVNKASGSSWGTLRRQLVRRNFHWVVSPHESFRTARLVRSVTAERKIGYHQWWNFWAYSERVLRPMMFPEAVRQMALLERHDESLQRQMRHFAKTWERVTPSQGPEPGLPTAFHGMPDWASMELAPERFEDLTPNVEALISKYQLRQKQIVFLAPGSVWNTKMWTSQGFAEVGLAHSKQGFQIVAVGTASEVAACQALCQAVPGAISLAGQTSLYELAQILRLGQLLYCNDSGAMHVASVVGLPAVSMFGPTTPELGYRPWQRRAWIMQTPLPCRPCGSHGAKKCPIGTHACMKELQAEGVIRMGNQIMQQD